MNIGKTSPGHQNQRVQSLLGMARDQGYIKESTYINATKWLAPSFAAVEMDSETVGDFIERVATSEQWNLLDDCFYKVNRFGTAGVRGKLAVGTANFNRVILGLGVEAHARYIETAYRNNGEHLGREKAVVLAYDSRRGSYDPETNGPGFLVKEAAAIYAAHGIRVYLFDCVAPTPELSFAISEVEGLKPYAGGVFTASHNPSSDNGFKPYDYYGGQVVHKGVQEIADSISDYSEVQSMDFQAGVAQGLIRMVGEEIDQAYLEKENQNAVWVGENGYFRRDKIDETLSVVFSSLNGSSQRLMKRVLQRRGFDVANRLFLVEEQCVPDGNFPTCPKPNPEEREALDMAIALADKKKADILIATDPDGDRIGVGIRVSDTEISQHLGQSEADRYVALNGNQQIVLLTDYILRQLYERDGKLPENACVAKTVVSTDLVKIIADAFGVSTVEPQVGFKYIGEKLSLYADRAMQAAAGAADDIIKGRRYSQLTRRERIGLLEKYSTCFLFGGEESYGSLAGDFVKDKDAVTIAAMFVEMAGFYKRAGKSLTQRLEEIYQEYCYTREETVALKFEGALGNDVIQEVMKTLRKNPLQKIAGKSVIAIIDFKKEQQDGRCRAKDAAGAVLFDDSIPQEPESFTGYVSVGGVMVPHFWSSDYRYIGKAARLPEANVLMYVVEGGSKVVVRPSGTEPKIKFYVLAKGDQGQKGDVAAEKEQVDSFFDAAKQELTDFVNRISERVFGA